MAAVAHFNLNAGQKASAVLHLGVILWVMLFGLFARPEDPLIPEVTEVALISAQDFAQLLQPPADVAQPITEPERAPPPRPEPPPEPEPAPEPAPEPIAAPEPVVPVAPAPAPAPEPPQAAVIAPQTTPDASLVPVQRPAERVAPEPAPTPDPQITIAPQDQAAAAPDTTATVEAPEAQEATQRAAAATETVTEVTRISETEPAQRTATAPEVSIRPQRRPQRAAVSAAPDTPREPVATQASAIEDALAEALAGAIEPSGEADTPRQLTQSEKDGLQLAIESCWNVGILSTEALGVVITIGIEMTPDARPIEASIYQVSVSGGSLAAQLAAFDAGRQAIVECGINGYGLPPELFDQWRFVEIVFNPARMSTR